VAQLVAQLYYSVPNQLEINGVDNWQNYGCMCEWNDDVEECIYCTDDSDYEGFLDLQLGEDNV
jgi:hypothetical protein